MITKLIFLLNCITFALCDNIKLTNKKALLPGKSFLDIMQEIIGQTTVTEDFTYNTTENPRSVDIPHGDEPDPPDAIYPVQHASIARDLSAYPLPLQDSDHELMFNVSWQPPIGPPARDYSIEVDSLTDTDDCRMRICYEYDIPGDVQWWVVPARATSVPEACAIRPGCAYRIRLIAHPWDGHTAAHIHVELDECVAGVCSCAHAPRLPSPVVSASTVSVLGEIFVNVSWMLPPPRYPQRLPRGLNKLYYFVSIGKQMVSDAHPAPWFDHTVYRKVDTDGPMATGDRSHWFLLPVTERIEPTRADVKTREDSRKSHEKTSKSIVLDVKLLARVSVTDDRGCVGPAGNATAYDPTKAVRRGSFGSYTIWAVLGGLCVLAMVVILAVSSRVVKRVLRAFRPPPATPLEPLRRRPAWFPR